MKPATAMKEALDAVRDPGCAREGPGVCQCCETRVGPANDALADLDDATVARMDWVADLSDADLRLLVEALNVAGEAINLWGDASARADIRRLRAEVERLT